MSQAESAVIEHLRAAYNALLHERIRLDVAITGLLSIMQTVGGNDVTRTDEPARMPAVTDGGLPRDSAGVGSSRGGGGNASVVSLSMRDAILELVRTHGPIKAGDAAEILAVRFGWQPASVRSLLAKMAGSGEVAQIARGLYEDADRATRPPEVGREDAEAPVAAGASDGGESVGDSSRKEGGTADGAVPPIGRDGSGNDDERGHGHGHRASVMEASR